MSTMNGTSMPSGMAFAAGQPTMVEEVANFVAGARWERLSSEAREALAVRVLDSLGCAVGAVSSDVLGMVGRQVAELGGRPTCTLIGGGKTAPDRAALYNGAAIRYLDFTDAYLAKDETCHPSDNLGAVLAAVEYAGGTGRDLLTALAVAYQVQCRLSDVAPVRARGFDHTTQGSYAAAAGVSRGLGLDVAQTANALAIAGTAFNALRVTRTGALSNWKGLAYPNIGFCAVHACFLAREGVTGPPQVFEGNKGFMDAIAGRFEIDWGAEDLEKVRRTALKRYNAEIHSQSLIEAILDLRQEHAIAGAEVEQVEIEVFDVAYNIIGGGEEGAKTLVRTKEQADHSIPYIAAVALLDGEVIPGQYLGERITRGDVQSLLQRVSVRPAADLSDRFPAEEPCRVRIRLRDGTELRRDKADYFGYPTRPMSWGDVTQKFRMLVEPVAGAGLTDEIEDAVKRVDQLTVSDLCRLLEAVPSPATKKGGRARHV
jgi:2-methylcitrate dehydratase